MNEPVSQPMPQAPEPQAPMPQAAMPQVPAPHASAKAGYIVGAIIVIVIAVALGLWYFLTLPSSTPTTVTQPPVVDQTQAAAPLSSGNTTSDISSDLNQTPDTSAALSADASASAQAVSGF